jgi:hypothetical protein
MRNKLESTIWQVIQGKFIVDIKDSAEFEFVSGK